ncbi:MAG: hypothetical protein GY849_09935 [Deltaproteobacteria bacterium]|nr:hypothetical protein [Deltaproteobacteria bacterium]
MRREGEIVLIHHNDQPSVFARIESIEPDMKKGWYHVTLLLLTLPTQTVTWILRDSYIDGEQFTMGGIPMRLEEVKGIAPGKERRGAEKGVKGKGPGKPGKVIPLNHRSKKRKP